MRAPNHPQRAVLGLALSVFVVMCRQELSKQSPAPKSSTAVPAPSAASAAVQASAAITAPSSQSPAPSKPVQGCPRDLKRRLQPSELPALLDRPNVLELMALGASGTPRRVSLRFHHSAAGCICPSFGLSDSREYAHVTFPTGLSDGHRYEMSRYYGFTQYELTGYFSGRMLDQREWEQSERAKHGASRGGRDASEKQVAWPEFCVEHWCYRPDVDPGLHKNVATAEIASDRAKYREIVSEMARDGVPQCAPPRPGEKGSRRDDPPEPENE